MPSPLPHRKSDLMHWNTCESPPPSDSQGASDVSEFDKVGEYYNNDGLDYDSPSSDTHTNPNSPNNTGQRNARWDSTQPVSSPAAAIPGLRRRKNATKRNADNADDYNNNNNDVRHTTEQKYDDAAHSPTPHTFQPPIFPFVHVNEVEMEADDGYRTPPSTSSPKRLPPPPLSSDDESDAKSFYDDNNNSDDNDSINNMDDDEFHRKNSRMTMKNSKEGTESTANLNSSRTSISEELNYIDEYNNDNNELNKMMLIEEGSSNGTSNSKGDVGMGGSAARLDRRVRRDNGDDDADDTYYDDYNDEEEGYYKKKRNSDSNSNSNFSSDYDYGSDDKIAQQIDNDYNTDDTESRVTTAAKSLISKIQYSRNIIGQMVNNQWVQLIIVLLIVINGIMMGVATSSWVTESETITQVFTRFDKAFLWVFTIEISMQLYYYGLLLFHDGWLIFDLVIVITSWSFEEVQAARAFRIFRAFRLLTRVKPLRDLVLAIGQVLPRMYAISALMVIIFYVFSVLFTELFSDLELSEQYFNTLWDSFFTCMQMMTLEWGDVTREVMEIHRWAAIPFVFYIMIAGFIVFNLIVAVVVEAVAATEETIRVMDGIETDTPQNKLDEAQERIDLMQSHVEKMMSEQEQIQTMLETMAGELLNLETERMKSEQRETKLRDEINRRIDYESKQNKIDYQRRMESKQHKIPVRGVKRSTSPDSLGSALSNQSGRKNSSGSRMNVFSKVPDGGNFALRRVDRRVSERKARVDEMYQSLSQHGSSSSLHNHRGGEDSAENTPRTRRKKKLQLGVDVDDALGIRSKSMHHVESRHDKLGKREHVKRHSSEKKNVSERKSVNWLVSKRGPSSLGKDRSGKSLGVKSCHEFQQQVPHSAPTARKILDINKIHDGAVSHSPKPGKARAKANWKNMLAMQQL